jgi:hypothetical protein
LPCHSCRHVENLQDISCCFQQWNSAVTSTIYASVASSRVSRACFVHSRVCLSGNPSAEIQQLTTSWCSISWTVQTKACINHRGFPLRAAINMLHTSLRTPAVCFMVNWLSFASILVYCHPTACCCLFLPLPVLQTIFKCASWVICLVAAWTSLWWTNVCPRTCYVRRIAVFDVAPANLPVFDPLPPGGGRSVSIMCWCAIGEEDDYERQWEALSTI